MAYPQSHGDRLKYWFWKFYTPFHAPVRDTSLALGIVRHEGRQDFLLGTLHPERSAYEFVQFLVEQGFGNHFIAWKEDDQLVSLRRTTDFKYQYHVRIFTDGEVRGHYEYTPECHPLLHLREVGMENRADEFLELVREWIVPAERATTL